MKRILLAASIFFLSFVISSFEVSMAQSKQRRALTRPLALSILQQHSATLNKELTKEVMLVELPFLVLRGVASKDEISGRVPLTFPTVEQLKADHVPYQDFVVGHILSQLAQEGILIKQTKLVNLENGLQMHYDLIPNPEIRRTNRYDRQGLSIVTYRAHFKGITGIIQEGTRAQVDADVSFTPTPISRRTAQVITKALTGIGLDPQQFTHTDPFKSPTVYPPFVHLRDFLLAVERPPNDEATHYLFQLYDDGWRLVPKP